MSDARRIPGSSVSERLCAREVRRLRVGPSPLFYERFGLADPWDGGETDREGMFSFLSAAPYYARLRAQGAAAARARRRLMDRLGDANSRALSLGARMARRASNGAGLVANLAFGELHALSDSSMLMPEAAASAPHVDEVPASGRSSRAEGRRAGFYEAPRRERSVDPRLLKVLEQLGLSATSDVDAIVEELKQLSTAQQAVAVRRVVRKVRGVAGRAVAQLVDEVIVEQPGRAAGVARARGRWFEPKSGAVERRGETGLRPMLSRSPALQALQFEDAAPATSAPETVARPRHEVAPRVSAASARPAPVAAAREAASRQQVTGRAGPVSAGGASRTTRESAPRVSAPEGLLTNPSVEADASAPIASNAHRSAPRAASVDVAPARMSASARAITRMMPAERSLEHGLPRAGRAVRAGGPLARLARRVEAAAPVVELAHRSVVPRPAAAARPLRAPVTLDLAQPVAPPPETAETAAPTRRASPPTAKRSVAAVVRASLRSDVAPRVDDAGRPLFTPAPVSPSAARSATRAAAPVAATQAVRERALSHAAVSPSLTARNTTASRAVGSATVAPSSPDIASVSVERGSNTSPLQRIAQRVDAVSAPVDVARRSLVPHPVVVTRARSFAPTAVTLAAPALLSESAEPSAVAARPMARRAADRSLAGAGAVPSRGLAASPTQYVRSPLAAPKWSPQVAAPDAAVSAKGVSLAPARTAAKLARFEHSARAAERGDAPAATVASSAAVAPQRLTRTLSAAVPTAYVHAVAPEAQDSADAPVQRASRSLVPHPVRRASREPSQVAGPLATASAVAVAPRAAVQLAAPVSAVRRAASRSVARVASARVTERLDAARDEQVAAEGGATRSALLAAAPTAYVRTSDTVGEPEAAQPVARRSVVPHPVARAASSRRALAAAEPQVAAAPSVAASVTSTRPTASRRAVARMTAPEVAVRSQRLVSSSPTAYLAATPNAEPLPEQGPVTRSALRRPVSVRSGGVVSQRLPVSADSTGATRPLRAGHLQSAQDGAFGASVAGPEASARSRRMASSAPAAHLVTTPNAELSPEQGPVSSGSRRGPASVARRAAVAPRSHALADSTGVTRAARVQSVQGSASYASPSASVGVTAPTRRAADRGAVRVDDVVASILSRIDAVSRSEQLPVSVRSTRSSLLSAAPTSYVHASEPTEELAAATSRAPSRRSVVPHPAPRAARRSDVAPTVASEPVARSQVAAPARRLSPMRRASVRSAAPEAVAPRLRRFIAESPTAYLAAPALAQAEDAVTAPVRRARAAKVADTAVAAGAAPLAAQRALARASTSVVDSVEAPRVAEDVARRGAAVRPAQARPGTLFFATPEQASAAPAASAQRPPSRRGYERIASALRAASRSEQPVAASPAVIRAFTALAPEQVALVAGESVSVSVEQGVARRTARVGRSADQAGVVQFAVRDRASGQTAERSAVAGAEQRLMGRRVATLAQGVTSSLRFTSAPDAPEASVAEAPRGARRSVVTPRRARASRATWSPAERVLGRRSVYASSASASPKASPFGMSAPELAVALPEWAQHNEVAGGVVQSRPAASRLARTLSFVSGDGALASGQENVAARRDVGERASGPARRAQGDVRRAASVAQPGQVLASGQAEMVDDGGFNAPVRTTAPRSRVAGWGRRARGLSAALPEQPLTAGTLGSSLGGGRLLTALARARQPEELLRVILERSGESASIARHLPSPVAALIERIVQAGQDVTAEAPQVGEERVNARTLQGDDVFKPIYRGKAQERPRSSPNFKTLSRSTAGAQSVEGGGASSAMKLAGKLQKLILLAESDRRAAREHVRMAEADNSAQNANGIEGAPAPRKPVPSMHELERDVLESVLRELELTLVRNQGDPDGWW